MDHVRRINFAVTAQIEERILTRIAPVVPSWVSADMLTILAFVSAFMGGIFYMFVENNPVFLHIINLCLLVHWIGDSLDGRIARLRNQSRPRYGYYVDHMLDTTSAALFLGGMTTSALTLTTAWVWVLSLLLLSMVHVFLKAKIRRSFELSIQQLGPTEARIGLGIVNGIIFFVGNPMYILFDIPFRLLDMIGWIVVVGFLLVLVPEILRTALALTIQDKK